MSAKKEKMNVLLILTDQLRADHMSCAGNPVLKTPNLDKFAGEGIRFTNAYCANPMCMPNRASIMTGTYPNVHGVRSNGINLPEHIPTFAETLRTQGYHTISIGKTHFQFGVPPYRHTSKSVEEAKLWYKDESRPDSIKNFPNPYYGFEEVDMMIGHGDMVVGHYTDWLKEKSPEMKDYVDEQMRNFFNNILMHDTELPEELYPTTYIELKTIEFLERYADSQITDKKGNKKPFFMHCSIPDPHHPVCPPGKYKDMYKPEDINFPSTFNDIKNLEKHPFLGPLIKNPIFRMTLLRETTEEEARQFIASTYGSIAMLDNCVGNILRALDKLGLADNTTVIFTSDHGDLMGDHGFILKGPSAYEGVLKVPMIWRVPGITPNGAVSDSLMSSIDISKTILNLAKIRVKKQSPDIQGLDVTPILKDPEAKVRDHCYIEEDEELALHKIRLRHLITETHSLTKYEGVEGYGDIFDKINDPDQLHNLWNEDKELRYKLLEKLFDVSLAAQSRFPKRISPS